jgi:hypothetical protein
MRRIWVTLFVVLTYSTGQAEESGALTLERLRLLATAAEAMRLRDGVYPPRDEIDNLTILIVSAYVRDQPYRDEWGTPFRYVLSADRKHLTIASAGANRTFETCGDDLAMRDGVGSCPASHGLSVIPASVQRVAAKLTMMEMRAISSAISGYQYAHGALPHDLATVGLEAAHYSVDPFPTRDAWGGAYRYELDAGGRRYRIFSGRDAIIYDGMTFDRAPRGLALALDRLVWPDHVRPTMRIVTGADHTVADSDVVELARAGRLSVRVVVTAPADDADVEPPEVDAVNQAAGYFDHHRGPNVFVSGRRIDSGGDGVATVRIYSSGGGGSETDEESDVSVELRDTEEARRARIKEFLARFGQGLLTTKVNTATFDEIYVANPPGTYEMTIEYRPSSGAYAGQVLARHFRVHVAPGPDTLDLFAERSPGAH